MQLHTVTYHHIQLAKINYYFNRQLKQNFEKIELMIIEKHEAGETTFDCR